MTILPPASTIGRCDAASRPAETYEHDAGRLHVEVRCRRREGLIPCTAIHDCRTVQSQGWALRTLTCGTDLDDGHLIRQSGMSTITDRWRHRWKHKTSAREREPRRPGLGWQPRSATQ